MELDYQFVQEYTIDNIKKGYIADSVIHGLGLFASAEIDKDDILCIFDGQIITWEKYHQIKKRLIIELEAPYDTYIFMEWNALDKETLLIRPFRTKYSYINHSRNPNVKIMKYPLRLIALCNIHKDEEITIDYREEPLNDEYMKEHGLSYL